MKSLFIAEIGVNHHGDYDKALRMIDRSAQAGAHIVKFQYYNPDRVLGRQHPSYEYAKQCQFTKTQHESLKKYCDWLGIEYCVSVFTPEDVTWAASLCNRMKVASRMNKNQEFLAKIDGTKLPVIMSIQPDTAMRREYSDRFYFMWCSRLYPSTKEQVIQFPFSYKYGLSSHCPDYTATIDAFKLGARIFENHVCESMNEQGCDIPASIRIDDFKKMVEEIRYLEKCLV